MNPAELGENFKGKATYQITVSGKVDPKYMGELSNISVAHTVTSSHTFSTLTGKIVDQGELNGLLNILFDNQYEVISVMKIDA
jgi:hypothetical protein